MGERVSPGGLAGAATSWAAIVGAAVMLLLPLLPRLPVLPSLLLLASSCPSGQNSCSFWGPPFCWWVAKGDGGSASWRRLCRLWWLPDPALPSTDITPNQV